MSERDFGWCFSVDEMDRIDSIRANGVRFVRERPYRRRWTPTSVTLDSDCDTSMLREVYVNGARFVPDRASDWDDVEVE